MTDHLVWTPEEVHAVALESLNERLHRYRLSQPKLERQMAQSLERHGQISPVVICLHEQEPVVIDGFK